MTSRHPNAPPLEVIEGGKSSPADLSPPHSLDAEREVLGACLVDPEGAIPLVADTVARGWWYSRRHAALWEAMHGTWERHGALDAVLLLQWLRDHPSGYCDAGDVAEALERSGTVANLGHYLGVMRTKWAARQVLGAARQIERIGRDDTLTTEERLARLDQAYKRVAREISTGQTTTSGAASIAEQVRAIIEQSAEAAEQGLVLGLSWGLDELDELVSPHPGEQVAIMGPRSHGKSALALQFAAANCRAGRRGVIYTAEMPAAQCFGRLVSNVCGVPWHVQRSGRLDGGERTLVDRAVLEVGDWPLDIQAVGGWGIERIASHARQLARQHDGIDFVVLDYAQKIRNSTADTDAESLSRTSGTLKDLAVELEAVSLLLTQPTAAATRAPQGARLSRPSMADSKGSGSIPDDADTFLVVFRPFMRPGKPRDEAERRQRRLAEIAVDKCREGEAQGRLVECVFRGDRMRFEPRPIAQQGWQP